MEFGLLIVNDDQHRLDFETVCSEFAEEDDEAEEE